MSRTGDVGTVLLGLVVVLLLAGVGAAEDEPRTITVTAVAEIRLPTEYIVINGTVVTKAGEPVQAQANNDLRVKALLAEVTKLGVAQKDIQTGYVSLEPKWRWESRDRHVFDGYESSKAIRITVRDLSTYDSLITGMLKAGMNHINSVTLCSDKEIETRRQARIMAVKAAKEKAQYMVEHLGEKVDKVQSVSEVGRGLEYEALNSMANIQAVAAIPAEADTQTGTLAPGTINIRAQVAVVFQLAD